MTRDQEVRVDPLTGLRVLIAPARAERPGALAPVVSPVGVAGRGDPFAPGHEGETPPTLGERLSPDGTWRARAFANLFPALVPDAAEPEADARTDLFGTAPAAGAHEVIVNTPGGEPCLADLAVEQVEVAVDLWRERMRAHATTASYVHLHVDESPPTRAGGASQPHSHAQLLALGFVPALVARERERFGAYAVRTMGGNLLADVLQEEVRRRVRVVAIDDEAVLIAPFASVLPYQLQLIPRGVAPAWEDAEAGPPGARLLHDAVTRLARRFGASPPLTLWVRTAPGGADPFCWHIDIVPRLARQAGLELGTGVALNVVAPERVAAELRDA